MMDNYAMGLIRSPLAFAIVIPVVQKLGIQ